MWVSSAKPTALLPPCGRSRTSVLCLALSLFLCAAATPDEAADVGPGSRQGPGFEP